MLQNRSRDDIDWSNIKEEADVNPEELARLDSPSGDKCSCGKDMTVGESEAFDACVDCYERKE